MIWGHDLDILINPATFDEMVRELVPDIPAHIRMLRNKKRKLRRLMRRRPRIIQELKANVWMKGATPSWGWR